MRNIKEVSRRSEPEAPQRLVIWESLVSCTRWLCTRWQVHHWQCLCCRVSSLHHTSGDTDHLHQTSLLAELHHSRAPTHHPPHQPPLYPGQSHEDSLRSVTQSYSVVSWSTVTRTWLQDSAWVPWWSCQDHSLGFDQTHHVPLPGCEPTHEQWSARWSRVTWPQRWYNLPPDYTYLTMQILYHTGCPKKHSKDLTLIFWDIL